uniref:Uncharacterized protein n=1 Tax=Trichuris muris TaxID=70415 RepID=A0A5S6QSM4_TRIMR
MDELSAEENELINVYKTLLLTVKQVIRPEHKELLNNVPLAIIKCVTTMEFRIVKSPEMVNMTKRLIEDLPNMEYADVLKELKIYVDELKRRRDVVVSGGDAGTVEWIKLKNRSIVATKQPMDMKSRDEITAALIKATRLLQKEMTKPLEWNRSDCRTIEKLERKIEILRNRLAASEGMSTSTGRYSMETPPEFASCGFAQIDNAVRELLNQCFPVGKTFGTRGRLVVRCPCHWEIKETVVRASQEHSLGLSNQMIDDIAAKLAVDIGVAIKQKERIDFELYLQDTASCYGLSETVPHDDIASVDFGGGDKNEQAADHPTEEKGPLHAKVDKVTEGKSDSQKEISKILDTVKVNVPKRRIVLSDPFIPEAGVSTVKTSDEQNLGKRKKKRKQNRQKVKEVAPAEKSKKRESADSSGCASKILQGNDRTGQRASLRNSAKRCGRRLKAKSRRLNEQTNPPLVEKHGADTHSLESAFKPQTRSSTSKASTSVSCSTMQNSLHDDHRQPTKGPNNRQHREKLVKAAPSQDCPEIIDLTFDD